MKKALFITGTDTGVGKTIIAGGLAIGFRKKGLSVGVFKPVETGVEDSPLDALFLKRCAECNLSLEKIVPYRFKEPLAPAVAAKRQKTKIDIFLIKKIFDEIKGEFDITLVEGAGGLLVPLCDSFTYADFALFLSIPVLVVARASLGTINHTLLTIRVARAMGIKIIGVIINRYPKAPDIAELTNPEVISSLGDVEVLELVGELDGVSTDRNIFNGMKDFPWEKLAEKVIRRI